MLEVLTHFDLFSGIGGMSIAAEWAGFETVGFCELADYPYKILEKHWPKVPKWRDIRDVTADSFRERTGFPTVDIITGGFPCQPFSVAGKQKGKGDDRYLWPEMLRVIRELTPHWVIGENVPGILRIAGNTVCEDLEREGYDIGIFDYEAAAVGAPHRRERVFFVANTESHGLQRERITRKQIANSRHEKREFKGLCNDVSNVNDGRGPMRRGGEFPAATEACGQWSNNRRRATEHVAGERRATQPGLDRVVDGISYGLDGTITWVPEPDIPRIATGIKNRVDRLKCLGNAVVPAQIYPILRAIAEIEKGE